jgi:hypothetical protein
METRVAVPFPVFARFAAARFRFLPALTRTMTDPDDRVIDEATRRGTLRAEELIAICEEYSPDDDPGVTRETLMACARELADHETDVVLDTHADDLDDEDAHSISDGILIQELRARRTDATEWEGETVYELGTEDDRLSAYPRSWHEEIGGETDIEAIFRFLEDTQPFARDDAAGTGKVSADRVITVASTVGALDPETARERLSGLDDEGEIVEASTSPDHSGLRSRDSEDGASDLPPTLDFRNALDEIEARTDADVSEITDEIRAKLEEFAERDGAGRESLLSDIDRLTVDLESRSSGNAARRAEGIRNQIDAYRESDAGDAAELSLSGARLVDGNGSEVDLTASDGALAVLRGTLVNGGPERRVVTMCSFYDDSGNPLQTIESRVYELDPGEKRDVAIDLYAPARATRYGAAALDASGSRAIGDAKPTP